VKTLHLYLTRQVLASMLMTAIVFTFILMLGNLLKDAFVLLVSRQASPALILQAVGLMIPYVWAFALPMAMLTATLLVFGRFSSEQELTAVRASGISLVSLTIPILVLSLVLCGICALINMEVTPRCWRGYKDLMFKFKTDLAEVRFPEGRYIRDFDGFIFYAGRSRNNQLGDVMVLITETNGSTTLRAATGQITRDETNQQINVELFDVKSVAIFDGRARPGSSASYVIQLRAPPVKDRKPGILEMTFGELRQELRELEAMMRSPAPLPDARPAESATAQRELERARQDLPSPIRVQIHQQMAFSFACFGFTLVGIPLGIRVHRKETNIGFALGIGLVLVYYCFMLLGKGLASRPELAPHLIVWVPDFIFQAVGMVLLWRANAGR
jgi:lipopolysaccharide export system permease protein